MKTIKQGDKIKRVSDQEADMFVNSGWNFISKKLWKETSRVIVEKKEKKEKK